MVRPVLYYALQRSSYSSMFNVMRITRVTPLRAYGSIDGVSTHCKPSQIYGKYDNEDDAKAARNAIVLEYNRFQGEIDRLTKDIQSIQHFRENLVRDILEAINGNAS